MLPFQLPQFKSELKNLGIKVAAVVKLPDDSLQHFENPELGFVFLRILNRLREDHLLIGFQLTLSQNSRLAYLHILKTKQKLGL